MHSFMIAHLRIFIADSDGHMLDVLHSLLFNTGVRHIASARNGGRALTELKNRQFDAIFISDNLAPYDALDLTQELRTSAFYANQRTPIILIAERSERSFIETARDAGVTEFIRKPITGKLVKQRLMSVLEAPRDFISETTYAGPDRRRRPAPGLKERDERRKSARHNTISGQTRQKTH